MERQKVDINELKDLLVLSVKAFYKQDRQLVKDDLCERALTFRIGLQLNKAIKCYHNIYGDVQSEFNKAYSETVGVMEKRIHLPFGSIKEHNYPDLILFNHNIGNRIIIEIKKLNKLTRNVHIIDDIYKLYAFTHPTNDDYCYSLGVHLILGKDAFLAIWYVNGKIDAVFFHSCNHVRHPWKDDYNQIFMKTKIIYDQYNHEYCGRIPSYTASDIRKCFSFMSCN